MKKCLPILLLVPIFSFAFDVQLPSNLKVLESTVLPSLIIQTIFGEYGAQIEKLEIAVVEGDKAKAIEFWQQTLPSQGWQIPQPTFLQGEQTIYLYSKGKDIFIIAPATNPRQLLLVEAKGVRDIGVLLGMVMKGLTSIAGSPSEKESEEIQRLRISPFPQAKLILEARIPGKAISEKMLKEEPTRGSSSAAEGAGSASLTTTTQSPSLLQSLLSEVEEVHFREFQLPSRVRPREVIDYYEGKLKEEGWQMVVKNIEPQPSFPYVLICGLKGNYTVISLIPEYPTKTFHTLDEIILLGKKQK